MIVERNIMMNKAGGNASKNAKTYRVSIPADMIRKLGVTDDDKSVILKCDNDVITISKNNKNSPGE